MIRRIFAISFIFACTALGWIILASTLILRTDKQDEKLRTAVGQLWGNKLIQQAPLVYYKSEGAPQKDKS